MGSLNPCKGRQLPLAHFRVAVRSLGARTLVDYLQAVPYLGLLTVNIGNRDFISSAGNFNYVFLRNYRR